MSAEARSLLQLLGVLFLLHNSSLLFMQGSRESLTCTSSWTRKWMVCTI